MPQLVDCPEMQSTLAVEVAERLAEVNAKCPTTDIALFEIAVLYEVLAHMIAAVDACGQPADAAQVLAMLRNDMPAYVADLRIRLALPPGTFLAPPPQEVQ